MYIFNGRLIGDICNNELFLKRTPTPDGLLADSELRYPYEGAKTLMHVFDSFDDMALIQKLLEGMYVQKAAPDVCTTGRKKKQITLNIWPKLRGYLITGKRVIRVLTWSICLIRFM